MFLMKAHALLAAFMLPAAIMFAVTGALYTWGAKGNYKTEVYEVTLEQPLQPDFASLKAFAAEQLQNRSESAPEGKAGLKSYGNHFLLEWTGSSKDVVLEPTADPLIAKLIVKDTTWYRTLVQLHKAKGGSIFKVYAVLFALTILVLLISGFMMAWQTPQLKRLSAITLVAGLVAFLIAAYLS